MCYFFVLSRAVSCTIHALAFTRREETPYKPKRFSGAGGQGRTEYVFLEYIFKGIHLHISFQFSGQGFPRIP